MVQQWRREEKIRIEGRERFTDMKKWKSKGGQCVWARTFACVCVCVSVYVFGQLKDGREVEKI